MTRRNEAPKQRLVANGCNSMDKPAFIVVCETCNEELASPKITDVKVWWDAHIANRHTKVRPLGMKGDL